MRKNGDILYAAQSFSNYNHFVMYFTNAIPEVPQAITMHAMNDCSHKTRSRKKGKNKS